MRALCSPCCFKHSSAFVAVVVDVISAVVFFASVIGSAGGGSAFWMALGGVRPGEARRTGNPVVGATKAVVVALGGAFLGAFATFLLPALASLLVLENSLR